MNFADYAARPDADPKDREVKGVHFVSDDGSWKVCASDLGSPPSEWCIWQRAVPGDRRPVVRGYVRRLAWARFTDRNEAMLMAAVLDDLLVTGSLEVLRHEFRTRVRDLRRDVLVRVLGVVVELARRAREDGPHAEDPLLRD